MKKPMQIEN